MKVTCDYCGAVVDIDKGYDNCPYCNGSLSRQIEKIKAFQEQKARKEEELKQKELDIKAEKQKADIEYRNTNVKNATKTQKKVFGIVITCIAVWWTFCFLLIGGITVWMLMHPDEYLNDTVSKENIEETVDSPTLNFEEKYTWNIDEVVPFDNISTWEFYTGNAKKIDYQQYAFKIRITNNTNDYVYIESNKFKFYGDDYELEKTSIEKEGYFEGSNTDLNCPPLKSGDILSGKDYVGWLCFYVPDGVTNITAYYNSTEGYKEIINIDLNDYITKEYKE